MRNNSALAFSAGALFSASLIFMSFGQVDRCFGQTLVAHWKLDEASAPYADSGPNHIPLLLRAGTTASTAGPGADGSAAELRYDNPPGVATCLQATNAALQTDSFGFSFWVKPVYMDQFNNLITKERPYDPNNPNANFDTQDWQVHLLGNDGSGHAPVELVIRGDGTNNFYGAVQSSITLPLLAASSTWYHICGGYDAASGSVYLSVNGSDNGQSNPLWVGATNSGGGAIDIGEGYYGANIYTYAPGAFIDDVQIYDAPIFDDLYAFPAVTNATFLMNHPGLALGENPAPTSQIIAHWKLDDIPGPSAPYVDSGPNGVNLFKDPATTPPGTSVGQDGAGCVRLQFADPGPSTRLFATNGLLQQNSFGFSLWLNPVDPAPGDNVLLKEMVPDTNVVNDFEKMAWQLHFLGDDGTGHMPLELVVRGDHRSGANFYGAVASAATFEIGTNSSPNTWVHVAGGYDAVTGELRLFVGTNGTDTAYVAGNNSPGADNSDGSPLSLGTAMYGTNYQFFAASTYVDDVQIYADALTSAEVGYLANPANFGMALPTPAPLKITAFNFNPATGGAVLTFASLTGTNYTVQLSTNLPVFTGATNITATGGSTSVSLSKAFIDGILGASSRPQLYLRVRQQ